MMVQSSDSAVNMLAEDDLGITYFIENAQQFWAGGFVTPCNFWLFISIPLQSLTMSSVSRVTVQPHYLCLILHYGGLHPCALPITVSSPSFHSPVPR